MTSSNFMFPASGWLPDLSPAAKDEIARRVPSVPVDAVAREAAYYVLMRDAEKVNPPPKEARRKLHSCRKAAKHSTTNCSRPFLRWRPS